ncbi:MAG: GMP synthase subunit A [Candidatus Anstonellales archaeon]
MIAIIDNGSQYTHLIKRSFKYLKKEAEIFSAARLLPEKIKDAEAFVLSGGPSSVLSGYEKINERVIKKVFSGEWKNPLLGICFGHQLIAHVLGGKVEKGSMAEYGFTEIERIGESVLLKNMPEKFRAWSSHFDEVREVPSGFAIVAKSKTCEVEAMENAERKIFSTQFHPEVWHTENGEQVFRNFLEVF